MAGACTGATEACTQHGYAQAQQSMHRREKGMHGQRHAQARQRRAHGGLCCQQEMARGEGTMLIVMNWQSFTNPQSSTFAAPF
eukprot:scaffold132377_cov19-Tisochrysis_lutea.AAC.1